MYQAPRAVVLDPQTHHWTTRGACRSVDPEMMFPGEKDYNGIAAAKEVCSDCPLSVFMACKKEHAEEPYGVWAGRTADEHRRARKAKQRRAARARAAQEQSVAA